MTSPALASSLRLAGLVDRDLDHRVLDLVDDVAPAIDVDPAAVRLDADEDVLLAGDAAIGGLDAFLERPDERLAGNLLLGVELEQRTDEVTTHPAPPCCVRSMAASPLRHEETWVGHPRPGGGLALIGRKYTPGHVDGHVQPRSAGASQHGPGTGKPSAIAPDCPSAGRTAPRRGRHGDPVASFPTAAAIDATTAGSIRYRYDARPRHRRSRWRRRARGRCLRAAPRPTRRGAAHEHRAAAPGRSGACPRSASAGRRRSGHSCANASRAPAWSRVAVANERREPRQRRDQPRGRRCRRRRHASRSRSSRSRPARPRARRRRSSSWRPMLPKATALSRRSAAR